MRVKLNPETTSHVLYCDKYPHGEMGYVVGELEHSYMVEWDSGFRFWYPKSDLIRLHPYRPYFLGIIAFITLMLLTATSVFAADNDELAFEFINSEPVSEVEDVVFEYACTFTVDEWSTLVNADVEINVTDLDPRDYCQSIKDAIHEY